MKKIELVFKGYYREEKKHSIASISGVYCVYSCVYNGNNTVSIEKLLYIGESESVHDRIANHERLGDWLKSLKSGQTLCYSYAMIGEDDRERAEAALIFKTQPKFNSEHRNEFIYNDTEIIIGGEKIMLPEMFIVRKGDIKK